ncbi:uncharacterized protein LOC117125469 [Anneissia japonica]|uniref:uncharacterized protein LOC117125469 n=1 Tax=Anneissia japonica TaxID=1529436 RepID=UPI001425AE78|nr:uncharacterized protein LOC117125469 [Anneissia japonica]
MEALTSTVEALCVPVTHTQNPDWAEEFEVPWEKMSARLCTALEQNKRPLPSDRRAMVRTIIDKVQIIRQHPTIKACNTIAKAIVYKHRAPLLDQIDGDVIGTGYSSLSKQLLSRWENVNRGLNSGVKRRAAVAADPVTEKVKRIDTYGCVDWQPELQEGQTEQTQLALQEDLKNCSGDVTEEIELQMKLTYYSQKRDINSGLTIDNLLEDWPVLFKRCGMINHFRQLTNTDIQETMNKTLTAKGPRIMAYMKTVTRPAIQNILYDLSSMPSTVSTKAAGIILSIMAYLGEKAPEIVFLADC